MSGDSFPSQTDRSDLVFLIHNYHAGAENRRFFRGEIGETHDRDDISDTAAVGSCSIQTECTAAGSTGDRISFQTFAPEFVSLFGAFDIISISATTIFGATAVKVFLHPCHVIAATDEQKPSTLAAVGQETKSIPLVYTVFQIGNDLAHVLIPIYI